MKSLKSLVFADPRPTHSEIFILAAMNFPASPMKIGRLRKANYQVIEIIEVFPKSLRK
jgi:hypothetical protein